MRCRTSYVAILVEVYTLDIVIRMPPLSVGIFFEVLGGTTPTDANDCPLHGPLGTMTGPWNILRVRTQDHRIQNVMLFPERQISCGRAKFLVPSPPLPPCGQCTVVWRLCRSPDRACKESCADSPDFSRMSPACFLTFLKSWLIEQILAH